MTLGVDLVEMVDLRVYALASAAASAAFELRSPSPAASWAAARLLWEPRLADERALFYCLGGLPP